jgi:hypothetical protein
MLGRNRWHEDRERYLRERRKRQNRKGPDCRRYFSIALSNRI